MEIIPVIDLKQGIVVHAKEGNRADYQPLTSNLCQSSDVFDVVAAFLKLHRFETFYIADLDAITRQGNNGGLIAKILNFYPGTRFWVDSGYPLYPNNFRSFNNYVPVLGTESFEDETTSEIKKLNQRFVLSLDYSKDGEMGAKSLFSNDALWPDDIIVMNLPRVGSNLGPDINLLETYQKKYPDKQIIAAGGVRNQADLKALEKISIKRALVASALHNGSLAAEDIQNCQAKKYPG